MDSIEDRLKQLNEIKTKVRICESALNDFIEEIGWTKKKLIELQNQSHPKVIKTEITEKNVDDEDTGSSLYEIQPSNTTIHDTKPIDLETDLCSVIDQKRTVSTSFIDFNKLKRDLKRRRVKYRTSTAPLTYTEELRELINLQMDLLNNHKQ